MEAVTSDPIDRFTTVEELEARVTEAKEQLTAIDAEHGVKGFSVEVRETWNELNEEIDAIEARLEEITLRQEILDKRRREAEKVETGGAPARSTAHIRTSEWTWDMGEIRRQATTEDDLHQKLRDTALHFVEQERFPTPGVNREDAQGHVARLLDSIDYADPAEGKVGSELARRILATGNPQYRKAFFKYVMGAGMSPEEQRALSQVTTAGGFALVYALDPTIIPTSNYSVNPWRALARNETIAGTNEWKAVTSGAITAAYSAEATEASDNAPTLAQPDIIVEKAQAYVPFSIEIGQDWGRLESEMGQLVQDAKDDLEALKFATGAGHGSNEPKGILTGATATTVTTTTGAFVIGDVYKIMEALPSRYRPRAEFVAQLPIINKVRQFDTAGGSGVWLGPNSFGLQAQAGGEQAGAGSALRTPLLGRGFYETSAGLGTVLTTGTKILLVGDFRYFVIVDRVGMNVEVLPLVVGTNHRPTGQRGLYFYWRNSSDVMGTGAFQTLVT